MLGCGRCSDKVTRWIGVAKKEGVWRRVSEDVAQSGGM